MVMLVTGMKAGLAKRNRNKQERGRTGRRLKEQQENTLLFPRLSPANQRLDLADTPSKSIIPAYSASSMK
jgi:hypothetical protein